MMQLLKIIVEQKSVKEDRESEPKSSSMFRKWKRKSEMRKTDVLKCQAQALRDLQMTQPAAEK